MSSTRLEGAAGTANLPSFIAVLVLDDQRFDRHKLGRLCNGLPMQCDIAQADCLSAFNIQLDAADFDLIFLDYNLPDGSGIDALEMIRLSPRNSTATSIMVTGFPEETIAFEAMTRGCADYIPKDELSPSSFERAVTNALQKSVLATEVQTQTFARAEVEAVLNRFATQCVGDIKPMVSRMVRQLRALRDMPADSSAIDPLQHRANLESSCLHLLEFLEELEKNHAAVMMRDFVSARRDSSGTDLAGKSLANDRARRLRAPLQGKRPPSPFSRRTH